MASSSKGLLCWYHYQSKIWWPAIFYESTKDAPVFQDDTEYDPLIISQLLLQYKTSQNRPVVVLITSNDANGDMITVENVENEVDFSWKASDLPKRVCLNEQDFAFPDMWAMYKGFGETLYKLAVEDKVQVKGLPESYRLKKSVHHGNTEATVNNTVVVTPHKERDTDSSTLPDDTSMQTEEESTEVHRVPSLKSPLNQKTWKEAMAILKRSGWCILANANDCYFIFPGKVYSVQASKLGEDYIGSTTSMQEYCRRHYDWVEPEELSFKEDEVNVDIVVTKPNRGRPPNKSKKSRSASTSPKRSKAAKKLKTIAYDAFTTKSDGDSSLDSSAVMNKVNTDPLYDLRGGIAHSFLQKLGFTYTNRYSHADCKADIPDNTEKMLEFLQTWQPKSFFDWPDKSDSDYLRYVYTIKCCHIKDRKTPSNKEYVKCIDLARKLTDAGARELLGKAGFTTINGQQFYPPGVQATSNGAINHMLDTLQDVQVYIYTHANLHVGAGRRNKIDPRKFSERDMLVLRLWAVMGERHY